jgi:hypothetical protein
MGKFLIKKYYEYVLLKIIIVVLIIIIANLIMSISNITFSSSVFCIKNNQVIQNSQNGTHVIKKNFLNNWETYYYENYRCQLKYHKDLIFNKNTEVLKPAKKQVYFNRIEIESLPKQLKCWVENSLKLDMTRFANSMELNKEQYIFIASGSEFYNVKIIDIFILENKEVVAMAIFNKLLPEESESLLCNNPYDFVYTKATGLPVRFVATGDDVHIPITCITGIDYLPNIVAQSQGIKVFTPIPNETICNKCSVSGVARIFEATLLYQLFDLEYNKLLDSFVTIGQLSSNFTREKVIPNSAINWRYFKFDIRIPEAVVPGKKLILKLYTIDPKNGNEINLVVIFLNYNC